MLFSLSILENAYRTLKLLKQKIEAEQAAIKRAEAKGTKRTPADLPSFSLQFNSAFLDLGMALQECQYLEGNISPLIDVLYTYPALEARARDAKTLYDYESILDILINPLSSWMEAQNTYRFSWYDYNSDFRLLWDNLGSSAADFGSEAINLIQDAIQWQGRPITLFNINCTAKNSIKGLDNPKHTLKFYGADARKTLSSSQRTEYQRVIYGGLKGSAISNDTFDILACLPVLTQNKTIKNNTIVKNEQEIAQRSLEYLRPGGIFIYALPYYRFYNTLCTFLARSLTNVQVFTTYEERYSGSKLVYVIGNKQELQPLPDMQLYRTLRGLPLHWDRLVAEVPKALKPISLPEGIVQVKRFRGSEFNEEEVVELYSTSKCTSDFWKAQTVEKLSESKERPLLPFSIGQLGLVLTSGCLDGIVDEGNGYKHVVKGRVIKRVDRYENLDRNTNRVQVESTTSKRVEINAFLADGTYKCLA